MKPNPSLCVTYVWHSWSKSQKRPFVRRKNRDDRVPFAKEHLDKDQKFLNVVIWSDETKINLFGYDGIRRVWRKGNSGNGYANTIISRFLSARGVGNIRFTDGIIDKSMCITTS